MTMFVFLLSFLFVFSPPFDYVVGRCVKMPGYQFSRVNFHTIKDYESIIINLKIFTRNRMKCKYDLEKCKYLF